MRLPLLLCITTLAAGTALAQQAGSSSPSSPSSPSSSSSKSSQSDQSSQSGISSQPGSIYSATGRASGEKQHLRSTKVIGAQVKTSSGEDVGRIEEVILNPTSGRIDFAVISAEGKLVPVPWQLLSVSSGASAQGSTSSSSTSTSGTSTDPSSATSTTPGSSGTYASASAGMQPSFTLNVDKSKLQGGPSFDRSRWPEMSASWSQRVYSHFGVSASGVGGTGTGSSTIDQGSTGSSTDTDAGKSSKDDKDDKSSSDPSKSSSDDKK